MKFHHCLFFIFLILKLCDVIDWSWWWVFSPLLAKASANVVEAWAAAVKEKEDRKLKKAIALLDALDKKYKR